jgi:outer membrane receptor protein involved in Fe transport
MPRVPLARLLRLSLFTVLVFSTLCLHRAHAAPETADEADLEFQLGTERYDAGDTKAALEHFLASNRLAPNKNVLFDIARCYEQLKLLPDAYRYYSASLEAETSDAGKRRVQESLERLKSRVALLTIESDPPGATIYLDRKDLGSRGSTPRTLALPEGTHTVLLELPDFEPGQSEKLELRLGEQEHAAVALKPLLGAIKVTGTKQAVVRLDSQPAPKCTVPCTFRVQVGKHVVSVAQDGFRTQEQPVEVVAHEVVRLRANLDPLSGSAVVNADVRDALISVDGQPRAFTPAVVSLPVGKHEIVVSPAGYRPLRRTVLIETDQSTPVNFEMSGQEEVLGASRAAEAVEDAPASVTIISRQELRAMAYPTIAEAIRGVRGMYLSNDDTYISTGVRGFSRPGDYGNRILVLLDGHATNDDWVGSSYVGFDARVDIDDVERIEVIRGAGSVVYGNGAFFGVINLVTRSKSEPTHAELAVSTALGAGRARATAVWHADDDSGLWVSVAGAKSAGIDRYYPEYVSTPAVDGTPSITDFQGNPATGTVKNADGFDAATVGGRAWYHALSAEWFVTSHKKHSPSAQYLTLFGDPNATNSDTRSFIDVQLEPKWDTFESLTRAHFDQYRYVGHLPYTPNTVDPTSFGTEVDNFSGLWGGVEQRLVFKPASGVKLTVGADFTRHFKTHQYNIDDRARPGFAGTDPAGPILDTDNPYNNFAGYALLDAVLSKGVRLSAGTRIDYFSNLNFEAGAALSPRLALIIKPYDRGNLKLMAGKAFRAPSQLERYYASQTQIASNSVSPEQVLSAEAEFTHRFTSAVSGLITGYTNYVTDLIELGTTSYKGSDVNQEQNSSAPVLVLGAETELRHEWQQGWMLSASVSVQKARYLNDGNRREVPNSPLLLGAVKAMMPLIGRTLNLATRLSIEGPRYDNSLRNTDIACDAAGMTAVTCPAQGTTKTGAVWDIVLTGAIERFDANYALGLYNAMDWSYDTVPSTEYAQRTILQRPRSALASISLKF